MSAQPAKSRLALRVTLVLAVLVAAGAAILYFLRPTARVVAVERGHATDARPGSIEVVPEYDLAIKTEVPGRVVASAIEVGKEFKDGDVLAQLDTGNIDIDLEKSQNAYDTHKAQYAVGSQIQLELDSALADLKNTERLHASGQISDSDLDKARRGVEGIRQRLALEAVDRQSTLKSDEVAIKENRLTKAKMTLTAPFDGVISEVDTRRGALISSGDLIGHLITITRTVEAKISEENFAGISVGDKANVLFLNSGKFFDAKVIKILPAADPVTQRYIVWLKVDIPENQLKPGMTGEVTIDVTTHDSALLAPRRAVSGNKILVVNDGRVELRTIKTGYTGINKVEIVDGVKEGDLVIAEDLDEFHPGDRVATEVLPN